MYVIEQQKEQDLDRVYLVNSTVSSQILKAMADKDGFHFQDTLTGFKWIGNKAIDLQKRDLRFRLDTKRLLDLCLTWCMIKMVFRLLQYFAIVSEMV